MSCKPLGRKKQNVKHLGDCARAIKDLSSPSGVGGSYFMRKTQIIINFAKRLDFIAEFGRRMVRFGSHWPPRGQCPPEDYHQSSRNNRACHVCVYVCVCIFFPAKTCYYPFGRHSHYHIIIILCICADKFAHRRFSHLTPCAPYNVYNTLQYICVYLQHTGIDFLYRAVNIPPLSAM